MEDLNGQSKPLSLCCQHCSAIDGLHTCKGCKVVRYCSKDHQELDWRGHKKDCKAIRKAAAKVDKEEHTLRTKPPDMFEPPNVFEEQVGHFWGILSTRPYMRARCEKVNAITEVISYDAVTSALDQTMDMLRLCRGDNLGMRYGIPSHLLRLGRDQTCYDFIKWYATTGQEGGYDWGNMELPFLDVQNADMLESVDYIDTEYAQLNFLVPLALLKIKLLLAIRVIAEGVDTLRSPRNLPPELFDEVQNRLLHDATSGHANGKARIEVIDAILEKQIERLYKTIDRVNKWFWESLLDPRDLLDNMPGYISFGSIEETQSVLQLNIDAWQETPGALEMIFSLNCENISL